MSRLLSNDLYFNEGKNFRLRLSISTQESIGSIGAVIYVLCRFRDSKGKWRKRKRKFYCANSPSGMLESAIDCYVSYYNKYYAHVDSVFMNVFNADLCDYDGNDLPF